MTVRAPEIDRFFKTVLENAERNQQPLDRLDAIAADGDHGGTFVLGWRAVAAAAPASTPGAALREAAERFASVGGSIGPLWGTALLRAAKVVGDTDAVDTRLASSGLRAALEGFAERGGASAGDKTLLDAFAPAVEAFEQAVASAATGSDALRAGLDAARRGAEATAGMASRRGRARRLAERSRGHIDPGAASAFLVWATAAQLAGIAASPDLTTWSH